MKLEFSLLDFEI